MRTAFIFCAALLWATAAGAAVHTETVEYRHGKVVLEGYLAYDSSLIGTGPVPGVLVVHEWTGLGDYVKIRARRLAELGYVAFAADVYGKGIRAKNADEAAKLAQTYYQDRRLFRDRVQAALAVLRGQELSDDRRLAAIGYCFGGSAVLELARAGADVRGVVSFHGILSTTQPAEPGTVKAKILVLGGADDPYVPDSQVAAFEEEMRRVGADWQLTEYGGAVHSFTNPDAGNDASRGAAYNEAADRRSWEQMKMFFEEIFW